MRIIKNSHSGVGGIATESMEMLQYAKRTPLHSLTLVHRDPNHERYFRSDSYNTSTHYLLVTKAISELIKGVNDLKEFEEKHKEHISEIERIIEQDSPDIAFCAGSFYYPWFLLKAAKRKCLPIVVRYAGIIEKEEEEPLWHDLGKDFIDATHTYIFPSSHAKKALEEINGIPLMNSFVIPNGIKGVFFRRQKQPPKRDEFKVAFVGRLAPVKNPEYFAELAVAMKKSGIKAQAYCVTDAAVFKEPTRYQKKVISRFREDGINLLPEMPPGRLAEFYRSMDLVVTPSHFETFGNVPLEATAAGTAALINDTVGVKEVFEEVGLEDLIVDFRDIDGVLRKIRQVKRERVCTPQEIVMQLRRDYNWRKVISSYFHVLEQVYRISNYSQKKQRSADYNIEERPTMNASEQDNA